jgi:hypothetical protein
VGCAVANPPYSVCGVGCAVGWVTLTHPTRFVGWIALWLTEFVHSPNIGPVASGGLCHL